CAHPYFPASDTDSSWALFRFTAAAPTEIYTLSLHDALPIFGEGTEKIESKLAELFAGARVERLDRDTARRRGQFQKILSDFRVEDRKSTRLNSSHVSISYAVFCLKKKKMLERERHTVEMERR